jgi:hypothetical protein
MTLASDIITRAYREGNIIPLVATPSTNQQNEALPLLNEQLLSAIGNEVGNDVADLNIGGLYDQSIYCATWVPADVRLILNLSGAQTFKLHPEPYDGMRLGFVDAGNNLATYNLTLNGNGRNIEGSPTVTLSTNGDSRHWIYRADTANWQKLTSLAASDTIPFPTHFDSFWTTRLAMRLNPRYGQSVSQETLAELKRIESQIKARYRKPRPYQEMPVGLVGERRSAYGLSINDFNGGRAWRW